MDMHEFAHLGSNTARPVPASPPALPRRNRSIGALSSSSLKSPTPPIPAKSPRRNVESPEPSFHPSAFAATPNQAPSSPTATAPRPAEQPNIPSLRYTHTPPLPSQIRLHDICHTSLPTSFYAPSSTHAPSPPDPPKNQPTHPPKANPQTAWHRTRLGLRGLILILIIIAVCITPMNNMSTMAGLTIIVVCSCSTPYGMWNQG